MIIYVNAFYVVIYKISAGSDKRQRISPWTPVVKIAHNGYAMSIEITLPKIAISTMGVYVENSHLLSHPTEISFLVT